MKVRVLFFASLRERLGRSETDWEVDDGTTVGQLWSVLCEQHPRLSGLTGMVRFAVNREYAGLARQLCPGDEVAVIPPVSGG